MIAKIVHLLQQRKPNAPPEWLKKLPQMAKRLEESLYRSAKSFAEYNDAGTLKMRLQQLAVNIGMKTKKMQQQQAILQHQKTQTARPLQQQPQQQQQQQQQNQEHSVESETSNVLPEPSNVVSVGFGDLGLDQWDNITSNNNNNNNNNEEFEDLAPIPYFPEMMNKPLDACSGRTLPSHPIEPLLHSLDPMPRSVVSADNDDEQYNWREAISNIESNSVVKNDRSNDSWNLPVISFDGRGSEKNQILFQPMDPTEMDSIFE
mmetsp:Transcript_19886/g.47390  ORF Transcript_19886/g.47390 Transcript_19886/m.47390 type:complete len:261 (+) Transcript_19886:606-1388(+)